MLYKILSVVLISLFFSCLIPSFKKAEETSANILNDLYKNDWNSIWDTTARSYRKDVNYTRFLNLKNWMERELGTLQNSKLTNFYSGSSFGAIFFKIEYDASFEKGVGKIKLSLIQEGGLLKISNLEFCKIPVY